MPCVPSFPTSPPREDLWLLLSLQASGPLGTDGLGTSGKAPSPLRSISHSRVLSRELGSGPVSFAVRGWARDSPLRGRHHLLVRLVSHNVVDNLETAGRPGGRDGGGEEAVRR